MPLTLLMSRRLLIEPCARTWTLKWRDKLRNVAIVSKSCDAEAAARWREMAHTTIQSVTPGAASSNSFTWSPESFAGESKSVASGQRADRTARA